MSKPQIQNKPLGQLKPYEKNSRTHTEENIAQIAKSIKKWGWTMPILVDENDVIMAGHARYEAAKKIGLKEAPCLTVSDWSDEQKKSYVIADNKLALNSGWDYELLASEIEELKAMDFDVAALGFGEAELDSIFKEDIDMSILDELDDMELDDFEENVKKAIQIEFEREHFGEAQDLIKFWRDRGAYVGHMIMMFLKQEKERL